MDKERTREIREWWRILDGVSANSDMDVVEQAQINMHTAIPELLDAIEAARNGLWLSKLKRALEEAQAENARLRGNDTEWSDEARADVQRIEETHGIELVSIAFCEQLDNERIRLQAENERLREKHQNEIHALCGAAGQAAAALRGPNRAIRQAAINAIEHHGCQDWIEFYDLDKPMRPDRMGLENERLREALRQVEPLALKPHATGQGIDGRWHDARICSKCGAMFKASAGQWVGKHRDGCVFAEPIELCLPLQLANGIPCSHPGCASHISHPCEGCGRIGAKGGR